MNRFTSKLTYANVMATVAVFLALGGGAFAVAAAKKNSVNSKSVKDASLTGRDVKDNSLTGADVDESKLALPAGVEPADGSVTAAKLADEAVTRDKLAEGSVTGGKILDGAVGNADLGADSVNGAKIDGDSVDTTHLGANAVRGTDANASGAPSFNFGTIVPGDCPTFNVPTNPTDGNISDDNIVITPPPTFDGSFTVAAEPLTATVFELRVCAVGTLGVDPDGAGGIYRYIAFAG